MSTTEPPPHPYEQRDPLLGDDPPAPLTAEQLERYEQMRRFLRRRSRDRLVGAGVIAIVVSILLLPILVLVGFEAGLFVWAFHLTASL